MKIQLNFNKNLERWIMRDENGFFVYDYPDCLNFNLQFPLLDKDKVNWYEMPKAVKLE